MAEKLVAPIHRTDVDWYVAWFDASNQAFVLDVTGEDEHFLMFEGFEDAFNYCLNESREQGLYHVPLAFQRGSYVPDAIAPGDIAFASLTYNVPFPREKGPIV